MRRNPRGSADGVVPVAAITSPQEDASLRGIATITGSATDAKFAYYQLLLRRVGESDLAWQEFGRGLTQVTNGALGQLDTTRYDNALYQIALRVVDVNGAQNVASVTVDFVGNLKLGQFRLSFADVRAEALGLPLMLTRTYGAQVFVPPVNLVFSPVPGPTGGPAGRVGAGAQLRVIDAALVSAQGGRLIDEEGNTWNPQEFELTTEEGLKYHLKEGVGILSVTDPHGNKVSYGPNGYQHSANLGLSFTRDAQGRITQASDPAGKSLAYTYNAQGELESVTDREGKVTRFSYATVAGSNTSATSGNTDIRHLLSSITDPRGQVVMSNQFDQYGRLTGTADASGQAASQQFDAANFKQVVTDRRGNRTVYTFDADGNITEVVNALGEKTSFTFDANGNETSVTNAAGETTTRTFDPVTGKQQSEVNPLGHASRTFYRSGAIFDLHP